MGIVQAVPCQSCRYPIADRGAGQPRFFLFRQGCVCHFSGSLRGASPVCPCSAGTTAFGNRTCSQPRQRGCSKGLGRCPNKQKLRFLAMPETAVSSLCGNKDTACQVYQVYTEFGTKTVIPRKILYRVSRRKADGTRGSALKTRYNKLGRNTPKPLPAKAGRDKTRYNIQL